MKCRDFLFIFGVFLSVCTTADLSAVPVRVTFVHEGRAVFAVFGEPSHQEIKRNWTVHRGNVRSAGKDCSFYWQRSKAGRNAAAVSISMQKTFDIGDYDLAVFSCSVPKDARLRVTLDTDQGKRIQEWKCIRSGRDEYKMVLDGAKVIKRVLFEVIETKRNKTSSGSLYWFGFENTAKMRDHLRQMKFIAAQSLEKFLASGKVKADFKGRSNMLADPKTLERLQNEYAAEKKRSTRDPLKTDVSSFRDEVVFSDLLLHGQDRRNRYPGIAELVNKGLIRRDDFMLKTAVRFAVIHVLISDLNRPAASSFMRGLPGQRTFCSSCTAYGIALVLDYCHELLSPAGEGLLAGWLAREGAGRGNCDVWHCRALWGDSRFSHLSKGRIASYLALEKIPSLHGNAVRPYTELAFREMLSSVNRLIRKDGSFPEGTVNFGPAVSSIKSVLEMYANTRKKDLRSVIPACMKNLGNFADVFISTDRRDGLIPVSGGRDEGRAVDPSAVQFLALAAPHSPWVNLYNAMYKKKGSALLSDVSMRSRHKAVSRKNVKLKPFVLLPDMGVAASHRYYNGKVVKLLFNGTKANTLCSRHNDKGSFVLEFAGDTFAADPGGEGFADAESSLLKRSDFHNMLVPNWLPDNENLNTASRNVYPQGKGNHRSFYAKMNAAAGSRAYFRSWIRSIQSPVPDRFTFTDNYTLQKGYRSARFLWITELPVSIRRNNTVRIDGKEAYCIITVPRNMRIRKNVLTVRNNVKFNRLSFERHSRSGTIRIQVRFFLKTPAVKKSAPGTAVKPAGKKPAPKKTVKASAVKPAPRKTVKASAVKPAPKGSVKAQTKKK